jgi:hypothetical protein
MRSLYKKAPQTNLGALLKLFSEDGISLSLVGVFNVESGHMSVRSERFNEATQDYTGAFRECDECAPQEEGQLFFSICETCGKNGSNFFWIPSGDGDGIYTAFELLNRNPETGEVETRGFATVLFPTDSFAEPIVEQALKDAENSDAPLYAFGFTAGLLDPNSSLEAFEVTKIEGSDEGWFLYVSDVTTTSDSDNATVSLHLNNCEELTILAFSEEPDSTQLAPKPRIIIGYSSDWLKEKRFSASMEKPYSRRVFDEWVLTGIQSCHLETMGDVATWFNFKMNEAMEKYNYAASWLLQGALHGDSDCIKEIDRYEGHTSDPEWIATWLGQRKQYQASADFEDGRLTFPFHESGNREKKEVSKPKNENTQTVSSTTFENKALILGQLWIRNEEEEEWADFFKYNNLGLPLAFALAEDIINHSESLEKYINETWKLLLESMEIEDTGFEDFDELIEKQEEYEDDEEDLEDDVKPEKVERPTWGSFRNFWTDCEMTITPYLSGFIDIEGGSVGISGKWFATCSNCYSKTHCSDCGRNPSSYLQLRAGNGDGIYSVFELSFEEKVVGALLILDDIGFAPTNIEKISETNSIKDEDPEALGEFYKDFYRNFYSSIGEFDQSLPMHYFGDIDVGQNPIYNGSQGPAGIIIFGESGEGKESTHALVTANNISPGKYRTFVFAHRNEQNDNILVPRCVLLLKEDSADQIGLTKNFAIKVNLEDETARWNNSTVFSRIGEPLAPSVIMANIDWNNLRVAREIIAEDYESARDARMEWLSWHLLFESYFPSAETRELIKGSAEELDLSMSTIQNARGHFNHESI